MTKTAGMGDQLLVAGYDLGGDINSLGEIGGGNAPIDVTDITQSGYARLGGRRDGRMGLTSYFDPAVGASHERFSALPTTDVMLTYSHGYARGNPSASMVAKQVNYDGNRQQDGSFTFAVSALANAFGLEWGVQISAGKQTDAAPGNSASYDQTTVSTSFGWQAYLHVIALTGTNVVITIQDSADNGTFANLSGGAFTSAVAVGWQRLQAPTATDNVRRYLRLVSSGTFSSATFLVMFVRNLTAVSF
jgi:hypothetical protein